MKNNMIKNLIVIATGGTGGHVFPAQGLAQSLIKANYKVAILIDNRGLRYLNFAEDILIKQIFSLGLHKKSLFFVIKIIFYLSLGFIQSFSFLLFNRPKAVVSFGSYASFPIVFSAILLRIPIIMHEQNSYLGKAHKIFVKYAKYLLLSFENTKNIPHGVKTIFTGLPIRQEILNFREKTSKQSDGQNNHITITILGGSQGANIFAHTIALAVAKLTPQYQAQISVYHQCRQDLIDSTKQLWYNTKASFVIKNFFTDVHNILAQTDIAISRSGASSIYEFSSLGCYVCYVPFAKASDNHQYTNALYAKEKFGADILLEQDFNVENVYNFLVSALNNKEMLVKKQIQAKNNCKIDCIENMIDLINKI
jgi:UDP-N-acetylglucosamine--N-acetylmuramyl-(pentapeptide) pyrophosphoryl-undecaprenol N-acetylglucosamine transferase